MQMYTFVWFSVAILETPSKKTAVILSHLYVIGLKIVLRDINSGDYDLPCLLINMLKNLLYHFGKNCPRKANRLRCYKNPSSTQILLYCWHFNIQYEQENSILGLSEPEKAEFLVIFIFMSN